jgi:hypothetical protein
MLAPCDGRQGVDPNCVAPDLLNRNGPWPPAGPGDVLDMETVKALTTEQLCWSVTSETRAADGVAMIDGTFSGGPFSTFNADGNLTTIGLHERAVIFLPPGISADPPVKGFVHARQKETSLSGDVAQAAQDIAAQGVAVLLHGEEARDWETLGLGGREPMEAAAMSALMATNPCEFTDLATGNFPLALVRTNLMAITLLSRVLESRGATLGDVALKGGSKEGQATWIASAMDDRITVAAPANNHGEDPLENSAAAEADWGCETPPNADANYPQESLLTFRNWLRDTPAGQVILDLASVPRFETDLKPRIFLISGDVCLVDMHDGIFFTPGAETSFLESFSRPYRYDRRALNEADGGEGNTDLTIRIMAITAGVLANGDEDAIPKVVSASLEESGSRIRVRTTVAPAPDTVRLWWNHSEDRPFDDPGQSIWQNVAMTQSGSEWISSWVDPPAVEAIAWYVEAEKSVTLGGYEFPQRDANPIRFIRRQAALSCAGPPATTCP